MKFTRQRIQKIINEVSSKVYVITVKTPTFQCVVCTGLHRIVVGARRIDFLPPVKWKSLNLSIRKPTNSVLDVSTSFYGKWYLLEFARYTSGESEGFFMIVGLWFLFFCISQGKSKNHLMLESQRLLRFLENE